MVTTKIESHEGYVEAVAEANRHRHLYYNLGTPEISDHEYDLLERSIKEWEAGLKHYEVLPDSPSRRVGVATPQDGKKTKHLTPMLSLDNAMTREEAAAWFAKVTKDVNPAPVMIAEPKFDGVALSIIYKDGKLDRAITRGDGAEGEDVTANVRTIKNVPLVLQEPHPEMIEVRGEVVMTHEDLEAWNKANPNDTLKNPRNGAVGSLKQRDPKKAAERPTTFYAHGIGATSDDYKPVTYTQARMDFARMGIPVYPEAFPVQTFAEAQEIYDEFLETRSDAQIDLDGMVLKIDHLHLREQLGNSRTAPYWAVAYKFPAETAVAMVLSIDLQVGRTGAITPVARIEPTNLMGTTIENVSLHNPDQIKRLDIAAGCEVEVARAGDVIPHILRVVSRPPTHQRFSDDRFDHCPCCTQPTDRSQVIPRCAAGVYCSAQKQARLEYFADRLGMKGIGPAFVEKMVSSGVLQIYSDFFILDRDDVVAALADDCGFGKGQIAQIHKALSLGRKASETDLLAALGLAGLGDSAAEAIISYGLDKLLQTVEDADKVKGLSAPARQAFKSHFSTEAARRNFNWMRKQITSVAATKTAAAGSSKLAGKSFCLTGTLSKTRSYFENLIRQHGGLVKSSVTRALDYLVAGSKPGSKEAKAKQYGVNIIDERTLIDLMK